MKSFSVRIFAVATDASGKATGRPVALARDAVSATTADRARAEVRALLRRRNLRLISVNHTKDDALVAYVEAKR